MKKMICSEIPENTIKYGCPKGFTLLEVLVSLAIIATVLVSIMRLQTQTIAMNETVRFYSVAPFLAQAKMVEIRMDPQSFLGSDKGDFGGDFSEYTWEIQVLEQEVVFDQQDVEMFFLDALVTVRHKGWGLSFGLEKKLPGNQEGQSL
jgi:type II secretion system protein I